MTNIVSMRDRPELRRLLDQCPQHAGVVRIDRRTRWGNPFRISHSVSRARAIALYREDLWRRIRCGDIALQDLAALHGKTLACWCSWPRQACHGEVLARAAAWASARHGRDKS